MRTGKKFSFWWLRNLGQPLYSLVELILLVILFLFFLFRKLGKVISKNVVILVGTLGKIDLKLTRPKLDIKWPKLPKKKKRVVKKRRINWGLFGILIGIIGLLATFYIVILKDLPSPNELVTREQAVSTKIYDRNGNLLFKIYKNENRSLIGLEQLPSHLIDATVAIEDSEFYEHNGLSLKGILRALKRNIWDNRTQGGSTLTQQLVKNALLSPEKTFTRKIKEMILAIKVELDFSKDEILQMYFNEVGYGGATYGIEEASQLYFGKPAAQLNLAEAALLAGLPAAPTNYSPFGANPQLAVFRQHQVLARMVEEGYISGMLAEEAKSEKLQFASPQIDIKAPHFVMYVKDLLVKKYGETVVHQGGLEVVTTLDLDIQELAELAVEKEMASLTRLNVTNAAALVTNPKTGEVLAMVGSRDYFDIANDGQVNVTTRPRQPGSSIKVITYAMALENGFTPATVIDDSPIVYRTPGSPPYAPKNYDNRFHGRVSLRQALASSYNIPAVKTLSQFGVEQMINQGEKMGITTWEDRSRYGLSLTLGGGEVIMVDMAQVYGVVANGGEKVDLHPILTVSDYKGEVKEVLECPVLEYMSTNVATPDEVVDCSGQQVLSKQAAFQLTDILSDNAARAPAFGRFSVLNIPGQTVAVKTGTSNNLRDNWTIGYSKNILTAVWVGNNDNSPMSYVASGITGASPIWRNIMEALLTKYPADPFESPENLKRVSVCQLTGTLNCSSCPNPKVEYFVAGTEPKFACNDESVRAILENKPPQPLGEVDRILEGISIEE